MTRIAYDVFRFARSGRKDESGPIQKSGAQPGMKRASMDRMTAESIIRVQNHFERLIDTQPRIAETFYRLLFAAAPELARFFPSDLEAQYRHIEKTLAMVVSHLGTFTAIDSSLRDLGARHLRWGAQPHHYLVARDALVEALRVHSRPVDWTPSLASDWHQAIGLIIVAMLRGAAMETAAFAEAVAAEQPAPRRWLDPVKSPAENG
jgi:hemoglobin-like flavoprotein